MPSLQIFFHVKVKKVRFTWKTIPRMGPNNSIPDSKQSGLQKNRAQRHGFSFGRSVEADPAASHPPSFGGLSPPRTTPCPQTHRVCGLRSCPPSSSLLHSMTKRKNRAQRHGFFFWSECGGSNSRPLRPERSALPTALHPDMSCERKQTSITHSNIYYITVHEKWKCFFVNFYVFL